MKLKIINLSKSFGDELVLDNLSLEVNDFHAMAIIGASGGGKTTLLRILAGLEKPDSGQVFVNGKEIKDAKFVMKAEDLHSSRRGMDANAYRALNTDKYPNIIFEANKLESGMVNGKLTINNVTKNIEIPVAMQKTKGFYLIKGEKGLNMSDYNVTPPTFYKTIKTGDQVFVSFYLILKEKK